MLTASLRCMFVISTNLIKKILQNKKSNCNIILFMHLNKVCPQAVANLMAVCTDLYLYCIVLLSCVLVVLQTVLHVY